MPLSKAQMPLQEITLSVTRQTYTWNCPAKEHKSCKQPDLKQPIPKKSRNGILEPKARFRTKGRNAELDATVTLLEEADVFWNGPFFIPCLFFLFLCPFPFWSVSASCGSRRRQRTNRAARQSPDRLGLILQKTGCNCLCVLRLANASNYD